MRRSRQWPALIVLQSTVHVTNSAQSWNLRRITTRRFPCHSVLAKLTYCSPAWSGYCTAADLGRLDGFLRRCRRLGYCEQSQPSITEPFSDIDDIFLVVLSLILSVFCNSFTRSYNHLLSQIKKS